MLQFKLTVSADTGKHEWLGEFVKLQILDARQQHRAEAYGQVQTTLPAGLYTLRSQLHGSVKDEVIYLNDDKNYKIDFPGYNSSIPFNWSCESGSVGNILSEVIDFSLSNPGIIESKSSSVSGGIMLFIHQQRHSFSDSKPMLEGFTLYDQHHYPLIKYPENSGTMQDTEQGWSSNCTNLASGPYYLQYFGKDEAREIPLYVYKGWVTQLFLTTEYRHRIAFSDMKILLSPVGALFRTTERDHFITDLALRRFRNGVYTFSERVISELVNGKFTNPMLGIIGAYLYLKSTFKNKDHLIGTVLWNLEHNLLKDPSAPDILALKLLRQERFGGDENIKAPVHPPMLRVGMEAIIEASLERAELLPQGHRLEKIADRLYSDCSWTSYEPLAQEKLSKSTKSINGSFSAGNSSGSILGAAVDPFFLYDESSAVYDHENRMRECARDLNSLDLILYNRSSASPLTLKEVSQYMGLPPHTIRRKVSNLLSLLTGKYDSERIFKLAAPLKQLKTRQELYKYLSKVDGLNDLVPKAD
ncbi:hypothetical protein [Pontibacter akesuensis]|uniref:Uncharacterized protein n=1 Tax=Pontibacter akesuensis TaxID=388950 RepID=A0A1I7JCC8_9BACT|nr:hypothetical protein [Pontibacter akesuensis]GHA70982.1 hypothetical protein GCM10007389_25520 [Pontibacter akesuensis]SFU82867.1 hypothetical protein SAMN04487941_2714 [Pontibacter akesuensis]